MKLTATNRGFLIANFEDRYGSKCSIQESSLATEAAIWLGVDDADPKIMCNDAPKLGVPQISRVGWQDYEIPKEVSLTTRMHLTQEQVKELLPLLNYFAEHGGLPEPEEE